MTRRASPARRGFSAALRTLLRLLWFVAIPLLLCGSLLRYATPSSASAGGSEGALSNMARQHALLQALCVFVVFAGLIRYWRALIPGGRYLSALPAELVERVPAKRIARAEAALSLLQWLAGAAGARFRARASAEDQSTLASAREELESVLSRGKWSRLDRTLQRVQALTQGRERAGSTRRNVVFVALVALVALLALQIRARYWQTYEVTGSSMLPTLTTGELLLGRMLTQASALPRRGQIVVLRVQVDGQVRELIKRVIGLPGDHIVMQSGHPVINGWPTPFCDAGAYYAPDAESGRSADPGGRLQMEFLAGEAYLTFQTTFAEPLSEYVVKAGEVFVLGDNRAHSRDSRSFDRGAPRGFPSSALQATVQRALFARTQRGTIDLSHWVPPLGSGLKREGVDMNQVLAGAERCLALRPNQANPPSPPALSLASDSL